MSILPETYATTEEYLALEREAETKSEYADGQIYAMAGASLGAHLAPRGITVNTVNPGATDTGYATPELYESVRASSPQGRWGRPEDAARLIGWLCADEARWVAGQVINSTGGGL